MKVFIRPRVGWMPEGVYHRTLKAEVVIVEGDVKDLFWDLTIYRYALQKVVDIVRA